MGISLGLLHLTLPPFFPVSGVVTTFPKCFEDAAKWYKQFRLNG